MPDNTENTQDTAQNETQQAETPKTETDWKAESRKWEKRAKDNKAAADELEKLKKERMTETERLQAEATEAKQRAAQLEAELEKQRADAERVKTALSISEETGVPVELLTGSDEDSMRTQAKAASEFAKGQPAAQVFKADGRKPDTTGSRTPKDDFSDWLDQI